GLAGVVVALTAVAVAIPVIRQRRREAGAPADVAPGRPPFEHGPDGPTLLRRLGMAGLVRRATGVVTWRVGARDAVAARTDGRGWATHRPDGWSTRTTVSGLTYTLVAVRRPVSCPRSTSCATACSAPTSTSSRARSTGRVTYAPTTTASPT